MNYDDWLSTQPEDREPTRPRDGERPCIKCETPVPVPYDYIGRPWCDRCVALDKIAIAMHALSKTG